MARDKVCVVIGAGDATGGAIARRFAREGYTAVVTRRHADKLQHLVAEITSAGGKVHPFGSDARDEEQVVKLFREIETEIGEVEVFVFNIGGNVRFDIRDTTSRVYRKVWEMTAFAGFLTAREAAKAMVPRGRGTMLFTGATASLRGGRGFSAFAGGKHAVRALAQSMARELGPQNIRVNALSAGPIKTLAAAGISGFSTMLQAHRERAPLRRNMELGEIADAAAFLLGPRGRAITGEVVMVDGGYHTIGL